jgi:hypothetical protein
MSANMKIVSFHNYHPARAFSSAVLGRGIGGRTLYDDPSCGHVFIKFAS